MSLMNRKGLRHGYIRVCMISAVMVGCIFNVVRGQVDRIETEYKGQSAIFAGRTVTLKPPFKVTEGRQPRTFIDGSVSPEPDGLSIGGRATGSSVSPIQTGQANTVGSIPGSADVGTSGSASYSIPIKLPDGVNGVQPGFSMAYNSQSADGMIGMGWNLTGLSMVYRGNRNLYYNGTPGPLNLNEEDNFYLDGALLMPVSGTNGGNGTSYVTESETYSKIESFGGTLGNPEWWRLTKKDGTVVEYGKNGTDRLSTTANLYWGISSVKDHNGNAVNYVYTNTNAEMLLTRVTYANIIVDFSYIEKENKNISFVNGSRVTNSKVLSKIAVSVGGVSVESYTMVYSTKIKRNYLMSIELRGADNMDPMVTSFDYGVIDGNNGEENIATYNGTYPNTKTNVVLVTGDFNNDGRSDVIAMENKAQTNDAHNAIVSVSSGSYTLISNLGNSQSGAVAELTNTYSQAIYNGGEKFVNPYSNYSSDFDGIGRDYFLRVKRVEDTYTSSSIKAEKRDYIDAIDLDKFLSGNTGGLSLQTSTIPIPNDRQYYYKYFLKDANSIVQGDFDGDGKTDILSVLGYKYQSGTMGTGLLGKIPVYDFNFKLFLTNQSKDYINAEVLGLQNEVKDAQAIYPIDFDGDGKQEIIVFNQYNFRIYAINRISATTGYSFKADLLLSSYDISYATYKRVMIGDFNGDRKSDILCINESQTATIFYGTGTGFAKATFALATKPVFDLFGDIFLTGDFNGDGITDIYHTFLSGSTGVVQGTRTGGSIVQTAYYFKGLKYEEHEETKSDISTVCESDIDITMSYNPQAVIIGTDPNAGCREPRGNTPENGYIVDFGYYTITTRTYTPLFTTAPVTGSSILANNYVGSPPQTGDFNGDGKTDIIQSLGGNRYVVISPSSTTNSSLLKTVTDGMGYTTDFAYQSLSEKVDNNVFFYTRPSISENNYPFNIAALPVKVVSSIRTPDGTGGYNVVI